MKNVKKLYLKILNKLYKYKFYKYITTMIQTNFTSESTVPMEPSGTWINMKTGETITVKTMVNDMSGNGSQLMLTDGRLMSFTEFSNNYVQMEEEPLNQQNDIITNNVQTETPKLNIDLLTSGLGQDNNNITNMYNISETNVTLNSNNKLESFDSTYETSFVNIEENENSTTTKQKRINLDNNSYSLNGYSKQQNIVKEFLNNLEKKPTINFKYIYIDNMPTEPISTFVKYLGVTKEDIVDVLYKELCNEDIIKNILTNYINDILENKVEIKTTESLSKNSVEPTPKVKRIKKK